MGNNKKVEYERMSLRHERVENEKLPKINIFYRRGAEERAQQIAYGIEEEGLPRRLFESESPFDEALEDTIKKGLGVAIGLDSYKAEIFSRQFKKAEAFMGYDGNDKEALSIIGKNASRMLKRKPFVLEHDE